MAESCEGLVPHFLKKIVPMGIYANYERTKVFDLKFPYGFRHS